MEKLWSHNNIRLVKLILFPTIKDRDSASDILQIQYSNNSQVYVPPLARLRKVHMKQFSP